MRTRRLSPRLGIGDRRLVDRLTENVAGHVDVHRARLSRRRLTIRGGDELRNAPGVVDPRRPFRDRLEHRELVDLLERLHLEKDAGARAAHRDQRRRVDERVGDTRDKVGRARPRSAHAHAGLSHDAGVGVRHQARGLLVAGVDRPGAELDDGGLGLDHGTAHDVEERVHALRDERFGENVGPG